MSLADNIKSLALEAGFHAVGITSAEPFLDAERVLLERYSSGLLDGPGHHPESFRVRTHPRECFPNARSIISVALSYLTDDTQTSGSSLITHHPSVPRGSVARFAWGLDYHSVLLERLSRLAESIGVTEGGNLEIRCFADTPLLLDRPVAVRAGVGSHGKNSCVYSGEYGSWVVLGELVTDIELDVDEPASEDICGDCEECMKACPTGAISAPYVIDRRMCLSQITQSKGFIPRQLREKMGTRIYGCDDCQSACPLNRGARPGNVRELRPTEGIGESPELIPLLNISAEEFARTVEPTTAGWIGRARFRRNVAVAIGNTGDPAAEPALREALSDPEPIVRGHAAWALGRIGTPSARACLEAAARRETHEGASREIRLAIDGC